MKYAHTIINSENLNNHLNHAVLFSSLQDNKEQLKNEIKEKIYNQEENNDNEEIDDNLIEQLTTEKLNEYVLSIIMPSLQNIEKHVNFSNVTNISDVNKLLAPYELTYDDLLMIVVKNIQKKIKQNTANSMNQEIQNSKQTQVIENINKLFNKTKNELYSKIMNHTSSINNENKNEDDNLISNVILDYIEVIFKNKPELVKEFCKYMNIFEYQKNLIIMNNNHKYTTEVITFYLQLILNNKKVVFSKINKGEIIFNVGNKLQTIQLFDLVNKIGKLKFNQPTEETEFYKTTIVNYFTFCYYQNSINTFFIINSKIIHF